MNSKERLCGEKGQIRLGLLAGRERGMQCCFCETSALPAVWRASMRLDWACVCVRAEALLAFLFFLLM